MEIVANIQKQKEEISKVAKLLTFVHEILDNVKASFDTERNP